MKPSERELIEKRVASRGWVAREAGRDLLRSEKAKMPQHWTEQKEYELSVLEQVLKKRALVTETQR